MLFSNPNSTVWKKVPFLGTGESRDIDSLGNIDGLGELANVLERSLNPVKDGLHDSGPEFHRERFPGSENRISHRHTRRLLVDLEPKPTQFRI